MNRRQFTASLGAAATLPFVPLPAVTPAALAATPTLPPAAYAWANLYARAQPSLTSAQLARYLRVDAPVAQSLFNKLIAQGVLGTPTSLGAAKALQPIPKPTQSTSLVQHARNAVKSLVKEDSAGLDANQHTDAQQETANASPDQHVQESPERG